MVLINSSSQRFSRIRQIAVRLWFVFFLYLPALVFAGDSGTTTSGSDSASGTTGSGTNIDEMLANLTAQIPYLTEFVTGLAYLSGIYIIFKAFYALKQYGEMRTMMASQSDLRGPMASIAIGAALMFSPTVINVGMTTVFGSANPMAYQQGDTGWDQMATTLIAIVQFVGGVAFIRGLMILHKAGSGQSQQATFGKGVIHLIGGVMALNIVGTTNILFTTLGLS